MKKCSVVRVLLLCAGALMLANVLLNAFLEGIGAGDYALTALGLGFVWYGLYWPRLKGARKMHIAAIVLCLLLLIPSVCLAVYGHSDNTDYEEDVVIVLGAGLHNNAPSSTLINRLEEACRYYEKNPDAVFIVTGGLADADQMSEAEAMTLYLTERGVPAAQILQESRATDTKENFRYSRELIQQLGLREDAVVFITSGFHVFRSELCARRAGLYPHHIGAPVDAHTVFTNYLRELMALIKYGALECLSK